MESALTAFAKYFATKHVPIFEKVKNITPIVEKSGALNATNPFKHFRHYLSAWGNLYRLRIN